MMSGPLVIAGLAALAIAGRAHPTLRRLSFTLWVFTFVAASMFYPSAFGTWFGVDLKIFIVPLVQVITFGMGTTLSARDFGRVFMMPWPVLIGIFLQFTVMPFVGYGIALLFGFEPEIAAGIVLIGSVSGGVASNLMAYLAGANVALSVTMTACSTLVSPVMTPFWMKVLAGRLVPVDFLTMMFSIINMIIVPIAAGLTANRILYSQKRWTRESRVLLGIFAGGSVIAFGFVFLNMTFLGPIAQMKSGLVLGFSLIAVVALAKLLVQNVFRGPADWMDKALPVLSMAGICIIIAIITARSRNDLLTSGLLLILAGVMHNAVGYTLGYWGARVFRLSETDCRTVSLEVGMQNGGMATGIAMEVLKSAKAALAPAIFGPWMNISGSVLASWWRRRSDRK
ncbi:MAG: bile acid:sodium symporter family protein [Candidatus Aminicenantales bacterium]